MAMFKYGDYVKEAKEVHGKKGDIGMVTKASKHPFVHYNVVFPHDDKVYEYHAGELKRSSKSVNVVE